MDNQKHWSDQAGEEEAEELQTSSVKPNRESKAKYEVVKAFSNRKHGKIEPGDEVPNDLTDLALTSLLRKGVLKALEE